MLAPVGQITAPVSDPGERMATHDPRQPSALNHPCTCMVLKAHVALRCYQIQIPIPSDGQPSARMHCCITVAVDRKGSLSLDADIAAIHVELLYRSKGHLPAARNGYLAAIDLDDPPLDLDRAISPQSESRTADLQNQAALPDINDICNQSQYGHDHVGPFQSSFGDFYRIIRHAQSPCRN